MVQSSPPVGNLPGGDSHNVGVWAVKWDPRSESLQGSGALVLWSGEYHQQRGKVASYSKSAPPQWHNASRG